MFKKKTDERILNKAKKTGKRAKLEISLYIAAGIVLVFAGYMVYYSISYIINYYSSYGMSISDGIGELVQSVLSNTVPYLIYALILFGMGRIVCRLDKTGAFKSKTIQTSDLPEVTASEAAVDEELSHILNNNNTETAHEDTEM